MRLSRRAFLAGAAAVAASSARAADVDVVIVGAGVAGLAAARELRALGKSCVVLEARPRLGGRAFTETALGAPYEAGALYIHWAERNPVADFARARGIATISDGAGRIRSFDSGVETTTTARARRSADFGRLGALLDGDDVADLSVAAVAHAAAPPLDEAAAGLARMAIGEEPERLSALDYARLWSGDDLLIPSGYSTLVGALADGADVRLSTPVRAIDWSGAGVTVETTSGSLHAKTAIVTVPVGVLREEAIRFTPALPASTRDALAGLDMGALSKIGMRFDFSAFDLPQGDIFARDSRALFDFDCKPFGRDVVVAIFGGDFARAITRDPQEAVATALDSFVGVVGGAARAAFRDSRVNAWAQEPYSRGCYSHCLPGRAGARETLAEPVGEKLFFSGEASAPTGAAMTTGGAWLAGQAAARRAAALIPS